MSSILENLLYISEFESKEVEGIFSETNRLQRWMDVESALAKVQGELGLIPSSASKAIQDTAKISLIDIALLKDEIIKTGHSLVPLLTAWKSICDSDTSQYLHYGATTQDIQDTALALECRDACNIIDSKLYDLCLLLKELAHQHRRTDMVGRTHGKAALPTTLGLQFAIRLDQCCRVLSDLRQSREEVGTSQLFGGVGTMASFHKNGGELLNRFSQELALKEPNIVWHTARDRFVRFMTSLGLTAGALASIAAEVVQLSKSEINELQERRLETTIGSSTMPHKNNPECSERIVTLFHLIKSNVQLAYETLIVEHQRDYRTLRIEWAIIPKTIDYVIVALDLTNYLLSGLSINEKQLKKNLEAAELEICSEALMFCLAEKIGKERAYAVVRQAYGSDIRSKESIINFINNTVGNLSDEYNEKLLLSLDYRNSIGEAERLVDAAIESNNKILIPQ